MSIALRAKGVHQWFYVVSEYIDDNGRLLFTLSINPSKAMRFTKDEADAFNTRHLQINNIETPFETYAMP